MPQTPVDKNMKFTWNEKCNVAQWKAFLKPIVFGKLTAKPREFASFMNLFEVLKFLNSNLSNSTAQEVYERLMGKSWFARFKVNIKKTGLKIKAGFNKAGHHIKATFNKIGKATIKGGKKIGAHIKGGLKIKTNVKAPKLKVKVHAKPKVGLKLKAGGKAKVGGKAKIGGKAKVGGKLKIGGKAKIGAKAKVGGKAKLKVGVKKMRRLQAPVKKPEPKKDDKKPAAPAKKDDKKPAAPAKNEIKDGFLPGLDTKDDKKKDDKKKDDKKPSNGDTTINTGADGLPVSKFSADVNVPELAGDSDQTAPKNSNLIKFAFMLFAAFMTMY